MPTHTFFIQGITPKNETDIIKSLEQIDGSKPIQKNISIGVHIFVSITDIEYDSILKSVASSISGTGAYLIGPLND